MGGGSPRHFWFLGFRGWQTAANVRTLALVEVAVRPQAHFTFSCSGSRWSRREGIGIAVIVIGVVLLIWAKLREREKPLFPGPSTAAFAPGMAQMARPYGC